MREKSDRPEAGERHVRDIRTNNLWKKIVRTHSLPFFPVELCVNLADRAG